MRAVFQWVCGVGSALCAAVVVANPIPLPVPASMPLEEMELNVGADGHVAFSGEFTFDFIPSDVEKMLFPLAPEGGGSVSVALDGTALPWSMSTEVYPTVLPEYPTIPMFEWAGPFPEAGGVFTVEYEHEVFSRGAADVLFYSLGTGKYFPTYDKVTTALLDVFLPSRSALLGVFLDDTPVPAGDYTFSNGHLDLTLESTFGPFTQDLIILYNPVPVPASLSLLAIGLGALAGAVRRSRRVPG